MAQEYLKQTGYNISNSQLQNLAKNRNGKTGTVPTADSIKTKADTLGSGKRESIAEFSIYENIIKNNIVDPDSIFENPWNIRAGCFKNSKPTTFAPEDYFATPPHDYSVGSGDEMNDPFVGRINEEIPVSR